MKTIYAVYRNADTTEGRGPMVLDSLFSNRNHANTYIDNEPGVMGRREKWSEKKYGDWKVEELVVYDSITEKNLNDKEILRRKALSKLSKEEIEALGVKV